MNFGILDFYDDPQGTVLKKKLSYERIPESIKTASYLKESVRERLPDDVFALVMSDAGNLTRKYACVDKGNTMLSVIYFLENADKLPEEAQKVAAANLMTACMWYDVLPPAKLVKLAGITKEALAHVTAGQWKAIYKAPHIVAIKRRIYGDQDNWDHPEIHDAVIIEAIKRHGFTPREKRSELIGSEIMPKSGPEKLSQFEPELAPGKEEPEKLGCALHPYVDITGKTASAKIKKERARLHGLEKNGQRFPLDSYAQVQNAVDWFNAYHESLHPRERHEFAIKLAARADELNIETSDLIKKYGSTHYAPRGEIEVAIATRLQHFTENDPRREGYQNLLSKQASVSPDKFCATLSRLDKDCGLDAEWDASVYDPWYSTYGFRKKAEWTFSYSGERITSSQLRRFAKSEKFCELKNMFGPELAEELKKDPEKIFDSLPLDTKRIIMRMAADVQP